MSLLFHIENLSYHINDEFDWDEIDNISVNPKELVKVIDYFLSNLSDNHLVPGKIYFTLCGIGDWARYKDFITPKQKRYSLLSLASYWNEIDRFKMIQN